MSNEQILTLIIGGVIGVLCTKGLPLLGRVLWRAWEWIVKRAGGWLAFRSFEKMYLDSLVSEHGNLNLTGVLNVDASAKPKLEDVFISLSVERYESSSGALAEELENSVREMLQLVEKRDSQLARRLRKTLQVPHHRERFGQIEAFLSLLQRDDVTLVKAEQVIHSKITETFTYLQAIPNISGPAALKQYDKLAILGAPGAGKTTLLQWVTVTYARHKAGDRLLRRPNLHQQRLEVERWKFPIFIRLSSIAPFLMKKSADGRDPTIVEVLPHLLLPHLQSFRDAQKYFARQLERGDCIVLLDGLDEVPGDDEFQAVAKAVRSLVGQYGKNQFVISSRMAGWRGGIGVDFRIYQVNELSDRQVEGFIDAWYSTVERNQSASDPEAKSPAIRREVDRIARKKAEELKQAIRASTGLRRLSVNPLLLSVVALVHRSRHVLPKERAKLYGDCSALMLLQWDTPKNLRADRTHLTYLEKESIIRRIAFSLHTGEIGAASGGREVERPVIEGIVAHMLPDFGRDRVDAPLMIEHLVTRSGMLSERRRDVLSFSHHTFQEYYTALELATWESSEVIAFLTRDARLESDWWREVITLYACLIPDAKPLLTFLLAPERDTLFRTRLRLALGCLVERGSVDVSMRDTILTDVRRIRVGRDSLRNRALPETAMQYLARWSLTPAWLPQSVLHSVGRSTSAPQERPWSEELAQTLQSLDPEERAAAIAGSVLLERELRDEPFLNSLLEIASSGGPAERSAVLERLWAFPEVADRSGPVIRAALTDSSSSSIVSSAYAVARGMELGTLPIPEPQLKKIIPAVLEKNPRAAPLLLQWGQRGSAILLEALVDGLAGAGLYPDTSGFAFPHPRTPSGHTIAWLAHLAASDSAVERGFAAGLLSALMAHPEPAAQVVNGLAQLISEGKFVPLGEEFAPAIASGPAWSLQLVVDALLAQGPWCKLQAVRFILRDIVPQRGTDLSSVMRELLFDSPAEVSSALIGDLRCVSPAMIPMDVVDDLIRAATMNDFRQGREYDVFAALANISRYLCTREVLQVLSSALTHPARLLQAAAALAIARVGRNPVGPPLIQTLRAMADEERHRIALHWEAIYGLKYQRAGAIAVWMLDLERSAEELISGVALDNPMHRLDLREISGWIAEVEQSRRVLDLLIYAHGQGAANLASLDRVAAIHPEHLLERVSMLLKGDQQKLGITLLSRYSDLLSALLANAEASPAGEGLQLQGWELDQGLEMCFSRPDISDEAWDFYERDPSGASRHGPRTLTVLSLDLTTNLRSETQLQ
jgi:hypothetical protein